MCIFFIKNMCVRGPSTMTAGLSLKPVSTHQEATYRPIGSASMFTRIGASAEFAGTSVYSEIPPGVPSSQSKRDLTNIPLQTD